MSILDILQNEKIIPVVKLDRVEDAFPLMQALLAGGCNVAEITFRTAVGKEALAACAAQFPTMIVGAGTIINEMQAREAVSVGAEFVVSPGFDLATSVYLESLGIPYLPGAVSPTEIMSVLDTGRDIIKFFPAGVYGGIKAIKALSAPFPTAKFIPTGGVNVDNLAEYLSHPAVLAVGGSWMVADSLVKAGRFDEIARLTFEAETIARSLE